MDLKSLVLTAADKEQLESIKHELGEEVGKMEVYVRNFKDWLFCEEYLPKDIGNDNNMIQNYIRHSKFDLSRAKQKFEKYLIAKSKFPEFYDWNFSDEHFHKNDLHKCSFILPNLTKEGYRIMVMMLPSKNVDIFEPEISNRYTLMLCDYLIDNDTNAGVVFIFDLRHLCIQHITKTPIKMFIEFIRIATIVLPTRIREIHIFNMNSTAEKLLNICKSLLSNKLKQRLFVHKSCEIQGYLTTDVLPIEFGGSLESIEEISSKWRLHFDENTRWIERINCVKLVGDVPKELQNKLRSNEEFGVEGCFRKLQID